MKTLIIFLTMFVIVFSNISAGSLVSVISSNNGSGLFTYKISADDEPYFFGGNTNLLKIVIPSEAVISTIDPPGWLSEVGANDTVTWKCTNSTLWYVDNTTREFSLQSSYSLVTNYTGIDMGFAQGEIYNTNYSLYSEGTTNGISSVNVVGYEQFEFEGPMIPEPCYLLFIIYYLLMRKKCGVRC